MATAGSIVIDLLVRTGSFETDTKRAEKRLQDFEKTAKRVGVAVGAALVGAGTAMAALTKNAIDQADEMSKLAQKVGLSTEEVSRLAYAGELADVSLGDLQSSMGRLIKGMGDALKTTSTQARIFDALGISVTDASGKMRSAKDVLYDFADAFKEQEGSPEIIAAGMEIFGRSFQQLIPLLKDGAEGLRKTDAQADALGLTLSEKTGKRAEQFNDNLTTMGKAVDGLALQVASDLLPDLESLTGRFVDLVTEGDGVSSLAHKIAQGFRVMESAAESSITLVSGVVEVIGGLTKQMQGFYEIAASLATFDWERRASGADQYRAGGAQINKGVDRLIDPHGANGLFGDMPRAPANAYTGPLLKPSQALADAEFEAEVQRIKAAREHAERLRKALGDPLPKESLGGGAVAKLAKDAKELAPALDDLLGADQALYQQMLGTIDAGTDQLEAWASLTAQLDGPLAEAELEHIRRMQDIERIGQAAGATAEEIAAAKAKEAAAYDRTTAAIQQQQEAMANADLISGMDQFRYIAEDFLVDLPTEGAKAWKDFFDDLASMFLHAIAQDWINKLFGPPGTTGKGTPGGDIMSTIFGSMFGGGTDPVSGESMGTMADLFSGSFMGGMAGGGGVLAGNAYLVGEDGPEMFVPRTAGAVLPSQLTSQMMGPTGITQNLQFLLAAPTDPRTQSQIASKVAFETNRASRRSG